MEQEDLKLKIKMPMIPLRDVVIFPNTVSTHIIKSAVGNHTFEQNSMNITIK